MLAAAAATDVAPDTAPDRAPCVARLNRVAFRDVDAVNLALERSFVNVLEGAGVEDSGIVDPDRHRGHPVSSPRHRRL